MTLHSRPASPDALNDVETDHPRIHFPNNPLAGPPWGGCPSTADRESISSTHGRPSLFPGITDHGSPACRIASRRGATMTLPRRHRDAGTATQTPPRWRCHDHNGSQATGSIPAPARGADDRRSHPYPHGSPLSTTPVETCGNPADSWRGKALHCLRLTSALATITAHAIMHRPWSATCKVGTYANLESVRS